MIAYKPINVYTTLSNVNLTSDNVLVVETVISLLVLKLYNSSGVNQMKYSIFKLFIKHKYDVEVRHSHLWRAGEIKDELVCGNPFFEFQQAVNDASLMWSGSH